MHPFRPVATAPTPQPPSRRRLATLAAIAVLTGLLAVALRPAPADPRRPAASQIVFGERSAWDDAIAAIAGNRATPPRGQTPKAGLALAPSGGGYVITSKSLPAPLVDAGLRTGDVLVSVDGQPLDDDRAAHFADDLGTFDDLEVTFRRGGELRDTLIVIRER